MYEYLRHSCKISREKRAMTLAIRACQCHGLPSATATPRAVLNNGRGQKLMFRPVTGSAVVARSTKTPLSGSRKIYRASSEVPVPDQTSRLFFTARYSAYSQKRAPFTSRVKAPQGFHQLGCTSLLRHSLSGTAKLHWPSASASVSLSRASSTSSRSFSTSYPAMAATRLDGTAIAKKIRERLAVEIAEKQKSNPKYQPCLKIIQGLYFFTMLRHVIL